MTQPKASYEVLERLAMADDAWYGGTDGDPEPGWEPRSKAHFMALKAYRAAITPKLRSRAEVDAEIVRHARENYNTDVLDRDGYIVLARLLRETTSGPGDESAREPKLCPHKDCAIVGHHEHFDIGGQFRTRPAMEQEATGTRCPHCRYPERCGDEWCMRNGCCGHGKDDE